MLVYQFSTISEWLAQNIYNKVVFLNDPAKFNDPTESNFSLKNMDECDGGNEFKEEFLKSIKGDLLESYNINEIEMSKLSGMTSGFFHNKSFKESFFVDKFADELLDGLNGEDINNFCHRAVKEAQAAFRISSFSKNNSNPLMWGHYADGMRGVCIEYDIDDKDLNKVEYKECYSVDVLRVLARGTEDEVRKTFLRKNPSWEYEDEYRVIKVGESFYPLEEGQIKKVYFGYRCSEEKADFIKSLAILSHGSDVQFYITRNLVSSQYTINSPVDPGKLKEEIARIKKKVNEHETYVGDEVLKLVCENEFGKD
ncbi:DUF2971 domain-containing protein [Halomonas sp. 3H]|uniref:DUF2971 domain-containing protein n=1 Tax=Halomonas sp. 3H TaxID=2952527 RepID=UPI0020B70886|nr:DUF2971 domain-containing protein [Halomonas sp. 3H]